MAATASKVADLAGKRDALRAERAELIGQFPLAEMRAQHSQADREAFNALFVRVNQTLPEELASVERALRAAKEQRGVALARTWNTSASTAALIQAEIEERAARLAKTAEVVNEYEAAVRAGASATTMLPLDQENVAALRALKARIAGLERAGAAINTSKLPPAVRRFLLEA